MKRREPINIHPDVRDSLRSLLLSDDFEGTGVGYSAFIATAILFVYDDPERFVARATNAARNQSIKDAREGRR